MKLHAGVAGASGQGSVTGSVSFLDVGTSENLGTAQMNLKGESEAMLFGVDTFPQALTVGTHTMRATYSGDSSFRSSSSAPATVTITKGTPQVDLRLSDTSFVATQPGRLAVVVRHLGNLQPTGTVQFFDAGASIGTPIPLQQASQSQGQIEAAFDNDGQHSITASYAGDGTYTSAVSAPLPIFVRAPFAFGGGTFSATVAAGQTTTFNLNVGPASSFVHFSGTVALSCSSPSAAVTCSVNPGSVAVSSTGGGPITVNVATAASAGLHRPAFSGWPTGLAGVIAFVLVGCGRKSKPAFGVVALVLVLGAISCGGGGSAVSAPAPTPTPVPPTHTTLVVQGSSGTHVNSITLDLTITH